MVVVNKIEEYVPTKKELEEIKEAKLSGLCSREEELYIESNFQ